MTTTSEMLSVSELGYIQARSVRRPIMAFRRAHNQRSTCAKVIEFVDCPK